MRATARMSPALGRLWRRYRDREAELDPLRGDARVVNGRTQGLHGRDGHAHVGQKFHAAGLLKKPISSLASADAYCSAWRMSSASSSGYSRTMSSVDIPLATRLTTSETVIRIPRMQARPPITAGEDVIRSNTALVYQPEEQSKDNASARGLVSGPVSAPWR